MIRRKSKKEKLTGEVAAVNRFGCGCVFVCLVGLLLAMILAGYLQLQR